MATARQRLTLEAFLQLPEQEPDLEYVDGVVTQKVSPKPRHSKLQGILFMRFELFGAPRRLASAFTETRVTFGGGSFVPDVIVYRAERVPVDENGEIPDDFYDPPDIAIEIASPGQTLDDLADRCRRYVEHGVPVALLVNPRDRSVRELRASGERGPLRGADRVDLGDVLPGFELVVDELFASLQARRP